MMIKNSKNSKKSTAHKLREKQSNSMMLVTEFSNNHGGKITIGGGGLMRTFSGVQTIEMSVSRVGNRY